MSTAALPPRPGVEPAAPSAGSAIRRQPDRGRYDRPALDAVLDAGWLAHVGLAVDGEPSVIPMVYARDGDRLLLHGSVASRLMRAGASGVRVCATVTHVDGLVLARSAFHHSVNYRSAVVRGVAERVTDPDDLAAGFARLVEHAVPGRAALVRSPSEVETRQTMLLALPLDDFAVKSRTGGPKDEPEDLDLAVWAGVVPLALTPEVPVPADDLAPHLAADLAPPSEVTTA